MQNRSYTIGMLVIVLLSVSAFSACNYDNEESLYGPAIDCTQVNAKFTADILPLVQSKCAYSGCHDATASGGVTLTSYNQVYQNASRIREAVVVKKIMPKTGSITAAELAKIKCWLDSGAPDN